jgi:transposase
MDRKEKELTTGARKKRPRKVEKVYSISEVAELLAVNKQTVRKWLSIGDPDGAVIPPNAWLKLPNGHIRIREWIVLKLQGGNI